MRQQPWLGSFCASMFFLLLTTIPMSADAQERNLLRRAAGIVKETGVGKVVHELTSEIQMLGATVVDLDQRDLPQISLGTLQLGVSGVEIKNGEAVRVRVFLFNPEIQEAQVPVPDPDWFVLVDTKGRRLERISGLSIEGAGSGATIITVPGLERVALSILYGKGTADAPTAILKVSTLGTIAPIPVHTTGIDTSLDGTNIRIRQD
jgi:hypothetical protein